LKSLRSEGIIGIGRVKGIIRVKNIICRDLIIDGIIVQGAIGEALIGKLEPYR
jgi:hypothetical protein